MKLTKRDIKVHGIAIALGLVQGLSIMTVNAAPVSSTLINPLETLFGADPSVQNIVSLILNVLAYASFAAAVLFTVLAAIDIAGAKEDPKKSAGGRTGVVNALVGGSVGLGAYTVNRAVFSGALNANTNFGGGLTI